MVKRSEVQRLPRDYWQMLLWLRWLLSGTVAIIFAIGQLLETLLLNQLSLERTLLDVILWAGLSGTAVWVVMAWISDQDRRYRRELEQGFQEQLRLNKQLQRTNENIQLLSDLNRRLADSITLDDILNAGVFFPRQLVAAQGAILFLESANGVTQTRNEGLPSDELAQLRERFGGDALRPRQRYPEVIAALDKTQPAATCIIVPLSSDLHQLGWIELYVAHGDAVAQDQRSLLETMAGAIASAISSARRRSQEERALYELERAIAEERARIARDIHDGTAQTLAFRRMRIDLWRDWLTRDPQRLEQEFTETKQILRDVIDGLRRAIFALQPVQFDKLGFAGGLHRFISEWANQHGWQRSIDISSVLPRLTPAVEAVCFRIIQEALTNVAKHAQATHVRVAIHKMHDGIRVTVSDNGVGFEPKQLADAGDMHFGLRQMQERVAMLKGTLILESQIGHGTTINAWLPLLSES